jgi:hypothetical protein
MSNAPVSPGEYWAFAQMAISGPLGGGGEISRQISFMCFLRRDFVGHNVTRFCYVSHGHPSAAEITRFLPLFQWHPEGPERPLRQRSASAWWGGGRTPVIAPSVNVWGIKPLSLDSPRCALILSCASNCLAISGRLTCADASYHATAAPQSQKKRPVARPFPRVRSSAPLPVPRGHSSPVFLFCKPLSPVLTIPAGGLGAASAPGGRAPPHRGSRMPDRAPGRLTPCGRVRRAAAGAGPAAR